MSKTRPDATHFPSKRSDWLTSPSNIEAWAEAHRDYYGDAVFAANPRPHHSWVRLFAHSATHYAIAYYDGLWTFRGWDIVDRQTHRATTTDVLFGATDFDEHRRPTPVAQPSLDRLVALLDKLDKLDRPDKPERLDTPAAPEAPTPDATAHKMLCTLIKDDPASWCAALGFIYRHGGYVSVNAKGFPLRETTAMVAHVREGRSVAHASRLRTYAHMPIRCRTSNEVISYLSIRLDAQLAPVSFSTRQRAHVWETVPTRSNRKPSWARDLVEDAGIRMLTALRALPA